jgi:acyl-CoA thioesterase-1
MTGLNVGTARASSKYGSGLMAFKRLFSRILAISVAGLLLAAAASSAEPYRIVGFGDSLMAGYQLAPGQSFPEKLEAAMNAEGHDVVISNAGVSGDTTSAGLARLDWSVPDGTDLVILELGANDMLRGVSPDVIGGNLTEMIERLQAREIDILLIGMLAAPNLGTDYAARFNAIYPDLAKEYDLPLYSFFLEGVAANAALLLEDGMHPNAEGIDRMVEGVLPLVEEIAVETTRQG